MPRSPAVLPGQLDGGAEDVPGDPAESSYGVGTSRPTTVAAAQTPATPCHQGSPPGERRTGDRCDHQPLEPSGERGHGPGVCTPNPSGRAAGTPRRQAKERRPRERQTRTSARSGPRGWNIRLTRAPRLDAQHDDQRDHPGRAGRAGLHDLERSLGLVGRGEPVGHVGQAVPVQRPAARGEYPDRSRRDRKRRTGRARPAQTTGRHGAERQDGERREQHRRPAVGRSTRPGGSHRVRRSASRRPAARRQRIRDADRRAARRRAAGPPR